MAGQGMWSRHFEHYGPRFHSLPSFLLRSVKFIARSALGMAFSSLNSGSSERQFRVFLFNIGLKITEELFDSLKFLCEDDDLTKRKIECAKTPRDFLELLWKEGKIWPGDVGYLTGVLETAGDIQLANWVKESGGEHYVYVYIFITTGSYKFSSLGAVNRKLANMKFQSLKTILTCFRIEGFCIYGEYVSSCVRLKYPPK